MNRTQLLLLFTLLISVFAYSSASAQTKFDISLLDNPQKNGPEIAGQLATIEVDVYNPEPGNRLYLENGFRSARFINEKEWWAISDTVEAYRIDIVYSKYPLRKGVYREIYPLLFNRIKATITMDDGLNDSHLEWNKILQTRCENDQQVDSLFHGVVIWYRTDTEMNATEDSPAVSKIQKIKVEQERLISEQMSLEELEGNVDFFMSQTSLPDSLKTALSDKQLDEKIAYLKRFYAERLEKAEDMDLSKIDSATYSGLLNDIGGFLSQYGHGDPVVMKVLDRHPEWKNMLVINDWTGSMYSYGAQVVEWHLLNFEHSGIQTITLFNDGDAKGQDEKEIGDTEGIYTEKADNVPQLLDLFNYVMLRGGGGDGPENDIEAILHAIEENPNFSEVVLIADNLACVRDIELADRIGVPVKVILCGYNEKMGVNKHYAYLASVTGGGIYTIDEDIENIKVKLNKEGDEVVSILDDRITLSSNKCKDRFLGRSKKIVEYTLKTGRFRKRKVRTLNASDKELNEVPHWIFRCSHMKNLNLSNNRLKEVPREISYLKSLAKLDLSFNQLEELPKSLSRVKYITHINLSNNQLSEFPDQLKYMKHLKELDLSGNSLTKFQSLKTRHLSKLNLANNDLEAITAAMRKHRHLIELNLSGNSLSELPLNLPTSGKLKKLDLSNNNISSLPSDLSLFIRLEELNLSGNPLSESDKNRLKEELIFTKITF